MEDAPSPFRAENFDLLQRAATREAALATLATLDADPDSVRGPTPPHPTPPHGPTVLLLQASSPTVAGRQPHGCRPAVPRLQAASPTVAGHQPHGCRPSAPRLQAVSAEWLRRKLEGEWLPRFETPRRSQLAGESLTLYTPYTHAAAAWVRTVWRCGKQ